jgi:hypothetical protein
VSEECELLGKLVSIGIALEEELGKGTASQRKATVERVESQLRSAFGASFELADRETAAARARA